MILGHQLAAYERLLAVAGASFYAQRQSLPVRPRTNTLLVGPSGSGKNFLAGAVAKTLGAPFLSISSAEWVLIGCTQRGAKTTWPLIVKFLQQNSKSEGVILFLDEVDKLCGHTSYETFLRTEAYKLLDWGIPEGLCDSDGEAICKNHIDAARDVLTNKTFIIGAGAFQGIWEGRSKASIGFSDQASPSLPVSLGDLSGTLPRELTNRFRAEIITLPKLTRDDYLRMINQTGAQVPADLRSTFLRLAQERIETAVECQQGCRFLEEIILDSIICERESINDSKRPNEYPAFKEQPDQLPPGGPGF
ncbi:MAG: AAA family ATPase [Verrucomicrobiota bacterium]